MSKTPKTLQGAVIYFADAENCREFMVRVRWPDGKVRCPHCGSNNVEYLPNARVFKCYEKHPKQKFSLKVGTVFEDSPIPLEKWLPVMWLIVNAKNGISSWEIHRAVGVTQDRVVHVAACAARHAGRQERRQVVRRHRS